MRLENNYEEESSAKGTSFMLTSVVGVSLFLLIVLGVVLYYGVTVGCTIGFWICWVLRWYFDSTNVVTYVVLGRLLGR